MSSSKENQTPRSTTDNISQDDSHGKRSAVEGRDRERDLDLLTAENQSLREDLELERQRHEKLTKTISAQSEEQRRLTESMDELKAEGILRETCGSLWDDENEAEATLDVLTEQVTPYQSIFDDAGDDMEKMRQLFREKAVEHLKKEVTEKAALLKDLEKEYKDYSEELRHLQQ
ncbi:hypothetical protein EC973_006894 [Apophysomyces ossiformis]|uniref:Uncharacterized protein n=1 Tax=Apophysomyces ossiformis TaxID=679940 RepID=A0A8H7BSM2_9FUNG|nr:hypothetical protein EC973_006894 [Apophysomyces ossiformis]